MSEILDIINTPSSSSNNVYTTILFNDCMSCNCPAGGRRSFCKHLVSIVHKNLELIKATNMDFYKNLGLALEMKNNPEKDLPTYTELLKKIIYVNKDTARQAFIHAENIKSNYFQ